MSVNKILAVISDEIQYDALVQTYCNISNIKILCDNPIFYRFLRNKGIDFTPIEYEDIKEKWQDIIFWACERALFSKNDIKYEKIFGGVDIKCVFYPWLSYYLAAILGTYSLAEYILTAYKPKELVLFDNVLSFDFPRWNINYFLNFSIKCLAEENNIKQTRICLASKKKPAKPDFLRSTIRNAIAELYARFSSFKNDQPGILVHGALSQLADVVKKLKKGDKKVLFYDRKFQIASFRFCRHLEVRYAIEKTCLLNSDRILSDYEDVYRDDLEKLMQTLKKLKWFTYNGRDFSSIIYGEILKTADKYLSDIGRYFIVCSYLIEKCNVSKIILSEDITVLNSYMAAFFESRNIKVYCISHGYPSLKQYIPNFSLKNLKKRFSLSETLVQSEHEKELYMEWGWDKEHLHVKGMPRFDKLVDLKSRIFLDKTMPRKMRLLYCASGMFEDIKDLATYPGENYATTSHHSKHCFQILTEAAAELKVQLIIKPHYITDEPVWRNCISQYKGDLEIILAATTTGFLDLLATCDLLLTGYSSTAIIESALLGIPSVMIYYNDPSYLCPLAKKNLSFGVRNAKELKDVVEKVYASFINGKRYCSLPDDKDELEFLIGKNDEENTSRVVRYILGG